MKKSIFVLLTLLHTVLALGQTTTSLTETKLGEKLENPYSISTMNSAYKTVQAKYTSLPNVAIKANYRYVRFLPKDRNEFDLLFSLENEDFILFDYPLDYEITEYGDYYHDPNIPIDKPTWLYTVVPINYTKPTAIKGIQYQVLEDIYIPPIEEEDSNLGKKSSNQIPPEYLDILEEEALEMTHNLDLAEKSLAAKRSKYHPSGRLTIETHNGQIEGAPNVTIRVRRWFKTSFGSTNTNGYFSVHKRFKRRVNFGAIYKNENARILAGPGDYNWVLYGGAFLNGRKDYSWNKTSVRGQSSYEWGGIMLAVHDYHTRWSRTYNITPPPKHLRIAAYTIKGGFAPMYNRGAQVNIPCSFFPLPLKILSDIYVDEERSDFIKLYGTVTHELAHAAHWSRAGTWQHLFNETCFSILESDFLQKNRMSAEAWAQGLEQIALRDRYGVAITQACTNIEDRIKDAYPRYIVRDLMDQTTSFGCTIVDNVGGFTLGEIFESLVNNARGKTNWLAVWRDNLITIRPDQREELKQYFAQWLRQDYIPCSDPALVLTTNYNTRPSSAKRVQLTNSNQIILRSPFQFKANNTSELFEANVFCRPAAARKAPASKTASAASKMEISNTTHNNTSDINDTSSSKSTFDNSENLVVAAPNPTSDEICIQSNSTEKVKAIEVKNIYSQTVFSQQYIQGETHCISLSSEPVGLYFAKIILSSGDVTTLKIQKE